MTVLVAEDDVQVAGLMKMTLQIAGLSCIVAADGTAALDQIEAGGFELALLDVMLPGADGYELLEALKKKQVPALFVSARAELEDRVKGLRLGAEDYIVKPFEPIELLARVEAALRRVQPEPTELRVGAVSIDVASRTAYVRGEPAQLTPLEYDLLYFLMRHRNIAYSREQLLDAVWGYDYFGGTRTVDMHVQKLRHKLDMEDCIRTVHKLGYRLEDRP